MPLSSVQQYVKGLIDGLPLAYYNAPLTAYIAPPNPGSLDGPTAYIWGSTWMDRRQTAPRPEAFKKVVYQIDIYLKVPDASDYAFADSAFPSAIDAIVEVLNTTTMPLELTDNTTNRVSQVIAVGEVITGDYAYVHQLDDQRYVMYECRLQVQIEEAVSYAG